MAHHADATSIHLFAYVQDADPGAIGAGKAWVDTTGATNLLKIRNAADSGWEDVGPVGLPPSGAAGGVLSGTYPNPGFAADMATQAELDAVDTLIDDHLADATAAHAGTAIAFAPAGTIAATTVQAAIEEVATEAAAALAAHTGDTTDAHDASAISVVPFETIAATDLQAALEEIYDESAGSAGLPAGGTAGQALVKQSGTDGDADWVDFSVDPVPTDLIGAGIYVASAHDEDTESLRLFISRDGKAWRPINHNTYTAPSSGVVRDPSIVRYRNRWWIAHTARGGAFDIIVSDDLVNRTHHCMVSSSPVSGSEDFVWAPEWFLDGGEIRIFFATDPSGSDSFQIYETHPTNDALTTWSEPAAITITGGPSNIIDAFCVKDEAGTFHLIYKNELPGEKYPNRATATNVLGPYTEVDTNIIGINNIEGFSIVRFGPGAWRMYYNVILTDGVSYRESFDDLETWGSAAAVTGTDDFSHCTALLVRDPAVAATWFETMATAAGSLLVSSATGVLEERVKGANNTVWGINGDGDEGYYAAGEVLEGGFVNPMTAPGDLIVGAIADASVDWALDVVPTHNGATNFGTLDLITDGNDATVFGSHANTNAIYTLELPIARHITHYEMVQESAGAGWRSSNYVIESSMDGSNWITRYTRPGTDAVDSGVTALTSPGTGKYWRFRAPNTGGNGWNMYTLSLFGGVADGDPTVLATDGAAEDDVLTLADVGGTLMPVWAASTGGAAALDDLTDVNAPTPSDGDALIWDSTPGEWVAASPGALSAALDDLTDVDAPTPADGDVLTWDSGANEWVAAAPTGGGGALATIQTKTLIEEKALGSDGAISFTSIPQIYDDLELEVIRLRSAHATTNDNGNLRFNNDSGAFYWASYVQGVGGSAAGGQVDDATMGLITLGPAASSPASAWASGRWVIPRYAVAEPHNWHGNTVAGLDTDDYRVSITGGTYDPGTDAAITRLDIISSNAANWASGSVVRLYGVKKEEAVGGGASDAEDVAYDNGTSGLAATDVQAALDEIVDEISGGAHFERLDEVVLGSDGGITFSSIPGTHRHLRIIMGPVRHTVAATNTQLYVQFNGDTANKYAWDHNLINNAAANSPASSGSGALVARITPGYVGGDSCPAGAASHCVIDIPHYANASFWKSLTAAGFFWNGSGGTLAHISFNGGGVWQDVAAITSIKLFGAAGDNFKAGTIATLYGYN
jgi:hypothetical protein